MSFFSSCPIRKVVTKNNPGQNNTMDRLAVEYVFAEAEEQPIDSAATNTVASTSPLPLLYRPDPKLRLPYPCISDDTEGIPAIASLEFPSFVTKIVDIGGGKFDSVSEWMSRKYSGKVEFKVMDPFNRSREHNQMVQDWILANDGVDAVTSVSVLNVIPTLADRMRHITLAYDVLRSPGVAYFKVWAGSWPKRGTGDFEIGIQSDGLQTFQANKWASAFLQEVASVFGPENVFADNNANCLVAVKGYSTTTSSKGTNWQQYLYQKLFF
eukprot:m.58242 g.58242  ORF g.58242 m.58242 type:complete len:268 (-) comp11667_c0_seq3:137-940(-)